MDGALDAPVISRENSSHEMDLIVYIAITVMKGDLCAVRCVTSCFITLFAQPQATAFLVTLEPKYKVMPVPHNPKDVPNRVAPCASAWACTSERCVDGTSINGASGMYVACMHYAPPRVRCERGSLTLVARPTHAYLV